MPAGLDQLGRAAADVDDERARIERAARRHPAQRQLGLLVSAQQLRHEAVAPLDLAQERLAVLGVAHGARRDQQRAFGAEALGVAPVLRQRVPHARDRHREQAPPLVDSFAEAGDLQRARDLGRPARRRRRRRAVESSSCPGRSRQRASVLLSTVGNVVAWIACASPSPAWPSRIRSAASSGTTCCTCSASTGSGTTCSTSRTPAGGATTRSSRRSSRTARATRRRSPGT